MSLDPQALAVNHGEQKPCAMAAGQHSTSEMTLKIYPNRVKVSVNERAIQPGNLPDAH
jgi:hypothetical protein